MLLLQKCNQKLKSLGIDGVVKRSTRPGKKLMVITSTKVVHFGSDVSQTYAEGAPIAKRRAYQARHSRIFLNDGRRAIDVKMSPAFLSWHLLW
jgi:Family of unknown function (DUF5754)